MLEVDPILWHIWSPHNFNISFAYSIFPCISRFLLGKSSFYCCL